METALSYLQLLPLTKEQRRSFVQKAVDEITNGENNPLQVEIWLKSIEDTISDIRKDRDVKQWLSKELDGYFEKSFSAFGANITKCQRKTKDYTPCNDSVLNSLEFEADKIKKQIESRKSMLDNGVNPETGEVFQKPIEKVTEYLKIEVL